MKKIIVLTSIFMIIFISLFTVTSHAEEYVNITTSINKTIVHPGETITLTINFDKPLGAYVLDVLYDSNLVDFVSSSEGTPSVLINGVRIVYYSATVASSGLTVTFRAIDGITTSNHTNFAVTATGLASLAVEIYEDVVTPVNENFIVEPVYTDYTLSFTYDGNIMPNEEKPIKIGISSPLGRYYDHVRLVAEAVKPSGANVKILGFDTFAVEHDLITEGWGPAGGYSIGGLNFAQLFDFRGLFDMEGDYSITLKLVDLDNMLTIAQNTFNLKVGLTLPPLAPAPGPGQGAGPALGPEPGQESGATAGTGSEALPGELPRTGYDIVSIISAITILSVIGYLYYNRKNK